MIRTRTRTRTRPRAARRALATVAAALLLAPLTACGGSDDSGGGRDKDAATAELTVMAASSLTDVFRQIGAAYEREHAGIRVTFSFAGSQALAAQVRQGAPADVLATANTKTMRSVEDDTGTPVVFARNRLVIVTAEGNPENIDSLEDLAADGLKVVLAAPEVPVGGYSKEVLDRQHLEARPVSRETNVRAVLGKVALGEADAGLVYATDAATAPDKVDAVPVPDDRNAIASYPAATLGQSAHPEAAASFVKWLSSPAAQKILREAGFQQP